MNDLLYPVKGNWRKAALIAEVRPWLRGDY